MLSTHPEVQDKLHVEIIQTFQSNPNEKRVSFEMLKTMKYLDAVVFETLRLFPPADLDIKQCVEPDILPDGTPVPKGALVLFDML